MADARLHLIAVSDFRSIKGEITVPLDGDVVLIHGSNGAGKTSILSAIELALTGEVPALRESSSDYSNFLTHDQATQATIDLTLRGGGGNTRHRATVRDGKVIAEGLLGSGQAKYFAERAYLPQKRLSDLLEIYQTSDPTSGASHLTSFVNDLLGLDRLDALIDGLEPSGDFRNTRKISATLRALERESKDVAASVKKVRAAVDDASARYESERTNLLNQLGTTERKVPPGQGGSRRTFEDLKAVVEARISATNPLEESERRLRLRQSQLAVYRQQLSQLSDATSTRLERLRASLRSQSAAYADWLNEIREHLPELANDLDREGEAFDPQKDPVLLLDNELKRIATQIDNHTSKQRDLRRFQAERERLMKLVGAHETAMNQLNTQLIQVIDDLDLEAQANALLALHPFVEDDTCPVCGRDFGEVSDDSLADHILEIISSRRQTVEELRQAQARRRDNTRLLQEARDALAICEERITKLQSTFAGEPDMASIQQRQNAYLTSRPIARRGSDLRKRINEARTAVLNAESDVEQYDLLRASVAESLDIEVEGAVPSALVRIVESELATIQASLDSAHVASVSSAEVKSQFTRVEGAYHELESLHSQLEAKTRTQKAANSGIARAKAATNLMRRISKAAKDERAKVVADVFSGKLNDTWRDLFIRLAPYEMFIPRFVPTEIQSRQSANLLVEHVLSGRVAPPGVILSSGNLNSAALTLFLSLNLTSTEQMPLLVLDDPVQSMDDVHVAQLAAVLSALAYERSKQVVIAVHERALYDYLRLELSPPRPGQRLLTLELDRGPSGSTLIHHERLDWVADELTPSGMS